MLQGEFAAIGFGNEHRPIRGNRLRSRRNRNLIGEKVPVDRHDQQAHIARRQSNPLDAELARQILARPCVRKWRHPAAPGELRRLDRREDIDTRGKVDAGL